MRVCPYCGGEIKVKDTRHKGNEETYRRYSCVSCRAMIFSVEYQVEENESFFREWRNADRKTKKDERKEDYGTANVRVHDPEED